ncbi:MAG TPA: metallophosphoesterase [Allocoleopsis sp.]
MKLLFTADWHIKLGQKNVPIDWAKNRYDKLFHQICDLAASEKVDLLIIGGDIFDKLPSLEELELYFDFIFRASHLKCDTIIYSGNHEALKKNTTFLSNLKDITYQIGTMSNEKSRIHIFDDFGHFAGIDFIPYNKLKEYHPADIDMHGDILCTHVRGEIPPHVKPEVPLELFDRWKVVLAGDLHSNDNSQRNILYPGSPLTTSFHRNSVDTGVLIGDTTTLDFRFVKLKLPQLIRKTIKAGEPMPQTDYDHTIYEVEGDMSELSNLESSTLLDKKVVKRETDTTLILDPQMSIRHEVEEYLKYILSLSDNTVIEILKEFNNHEIISE